MWKIFKADLAYNKFGFIIAYALAFVIHFGGFYPQIASSMILFFIAIGMMSSQSDKEKRDRFHTLLPIPIKQLAFIRLAFVIVFQLGFVVILVSHFLNTSFGKDNSAFWSILVANGFIHSVINVFIIYSELGFFNKKRYRFTFLGIIAVVLILIALVLYLGYLRTFFIISTEIRKTPIDALILNVICFCMFYISYVLFIRRKSYLA